MKILNANCRLLAVLLLLVLEACTDYASKMEDDFEEWKAAQAQSSEGEVVVSSSSITPKSRSNETDVSSSSVPEGYVDPSTVVTGSVTDERDGQTYKTVTIGTQTWMAQNLNYETANSACYNDEASNCTKYGRLYTWAAAMDSSGTWSTNGKGCGYEKECSPTYPVRGVCPDGWHLPTSTEFSVLEQAVGGQSTAGKMLKSTSGWYNSGYGTDAYSFAALPGFDAYIATFWSSTERDSRDAIRMDLLAQSDETILTQYHRNSFYSVRCVKDENSSSITPQSSSSATSVSSSSVKSSSSAPSSSSEIKLETLTDERDGQTYKIVTIGSQTWMAENLNYETDNSYCYNDSPSNCTKYGRLYTWNAAKMACPSGWHLPALAEFDTLYVAVGGKSSAGAALKSVSGWIVDDECKGSEKCVSDYEDAYLFTVLPAGVRRNGTYGGEGGDARFWTSSEYSSDDAFLTYMESYYNEANDYYDSKDAGYSLRCIKGEVAIAKSSSSVSPQSNLSSSSKEVSSSSEIVKSSSSGKASWAYLNPAISYGEMTDDRDGQVYKTVVIGEQTWMAENLNLETANSYCYNDSTKYCDKYGRLYTWADALEACPADWHLPDSTESEKLLSTVGGEYVAGTNLKSISDWVENGNGGVDTYGFSAIPAGYKSKEGEYGGLSEYANFWLSAEYSSEKGRLMFFYYGGRGGMIGYNYKNELYSIRCLKNETPKSSSSISSSSSKASWAYLNPSYSYGEMTDDRDGQVYKTVEIGEQTWMAENLNYAYLSLESDSDSLSFCYDNDPLNCSKYGRLYRWSAAMDSAGMFSTTGKGCGYSVCLPTGNVRGVCPEGWHLPSKNEIFNSDYSNPIYWQDSISSWYMSGLTIPASGYMGQIGGFDYKNKYAGLWTSSEVASDGYAFSLFLRYDDSFTRKDGDNKNNGYSVRCVKD